jgi:hypothetical protein
VIQTLVLEAIEFGAQAGPGHQAVPVKRSHQDRPSTGWIRGQGANSLLYTIQPAADPPPAIEVTITATATTPQHVEIGAALEIHSGRVLGTPALVSVAIQAGTNQHQIRMNLSGAGLQAVGRHRVRWTWNCVPKPGAPAVAFDESVHDVYVAVGRATVPWADGVNTGETPRTDALDWSCRWAEGAKTLEEAASQVTNRIFEIGGLGVTSFGEAMAFTYHGGMHFDGGSGYAFMISDFLAMLTGQTDRTPAWANCEDLSCAVVTFANILGCRLGRFRLFDRDEETIASNALRLIGLDAAGTAATMPPAGFSYHEVAGVAGVASVANAPAVVYDACLGFNRGSARRSFWQPSAGITEPDYRARLVAKPRLKAIVWESRPMLPLDERPHGIVDDPDPFLFARYERFLHYLQETSPGNEGVASPGTNPPGYTWSDEPVWVKAVHSRFVSAVRQELWLLRPTDPRAETVQVRLSRLQNPLESMQVAAETLAWTPLPFERSVVPPGAPFLIDPGDSMGGFAARSQAWIVETAPGTHGLRALVQQLVLNAI